VPPELASADFALDESAAPQAISVAAAAAAATMAHDVAELAIGLPFGIVTAATKAVPADSEAAAGEVEGAETVAIAAIAATSQVPPTAFQGYQCCLAQSPAVPLEEPIAARLLLSRKVSSAKCRSSAVVRQHTCPCAPSASEAAQRVRFVEHSVRLACI
jgi:hypothetical protein